MKKILSVVLVATLALSTQTFAQTSKNITGSVDNTVNKVSEQTTNIVDKTSNGIGTLYGDSKNAISTVYGDLKTVAPKVEEAVKEIAKGLKTGAESVWDILVKQQIVWSFCYLILFIIAIVAWINFYYRYNKSRNSALAHDGDWSIMDISICLVSLGLAVVSSIHAIQYLEPMMTGFINPEFGAMKNIIQFASTLK